MSSTTHSWFCLVMARATADNHFLRQLVSQWCEIFVRNFIIDANMWPIQMHYNRELYQPPTVPPQSSRWAGRPVLKKVLTFACQPDHSVDLSQLSVNSQLELEYSSMSSLIALRFEVMCLTLCELQRVVWVWLLYTEAGLKEEHGKDE